MFSLAFILVSHNILQLSPEGEVNSGGYIPRREASCQLEYIIDNIIVKNEIIISRPDS